MSLVNLIESELKQIDGGRFQTLANQYLFRKLELWQFNAYGSQGGTDKTVPGVPDAFAMNDDRFVLIAHTTQQSDVKEKLETEIKTCLDGAKVSVPESKIGKIICCHTKFHLSLDDENYLRSIDDRVEIVGPDQIAQDLATRYPLLAHECLGTPIVHHALQTLDEYMKKQEASRFSSGHSYDFLYRDQDYEDLGDEIDAHSIVVLVGKTGCGKTRLAVEVGAHYSETHGMDFLILESTAIGRCDNDIELYLRDSCGAVVVVDDAHDQAVLNHLLDIALLNNRVKLIMTSRAMLADSLIQSIQLIADYARFDLKELGENEVFSIIRKNNPDLGCNRVNRIVRAAKGNLRIAIMAAQQIADGESNLDVYSILDAYMSPHLDECSGAEKEILGIIAVYKVVDITDDNVACRLLAERGFTLSGVLEVARRFDEREIITSMLSFEGVEAVRFEQQNLRDYLIYKLFVRDRTLRLSSFINEQHEQGFERAHSVIYSLLEVFDDAETRRYIEIELQEAWRLAGDVARRERLFNEFSVQFGSFALPYVAEQLHSCEGRDIAHSIIGSASLWVTSPTLRLLNSLKEDSAHKATVIQLVVSSVVLGSEDPACYRWMFSSGNAFSCSSPLNSFEFEKRLLQSLYANWIETGNGNSAACLLLLVEGLLSGEAPSDYVGPVWHDGRVRRLGVTDELIQLNVQCFDVLRGLLDSEWKSYALRVFRNHFTIDRFLLENKMMVELIAAEAILLGDDLIPFLADGRFGTFECYSSIAKTLEISKSDYPLPAIEFSSGLIDLAEMVGNLDNLDADLYLTWEVGRIRLMLKEAQAIPSSADVFWRVQHGIACVLENLWLSGECDDLRLLEAYLASLDSRFGPPSAKAIECLLNRHGVEKVISFFEHHEYGELGEVARDAADVSIIRSGLTEEVAQEILSRVSDGKCHLDFLVVMKADETRKWFGYEYTKRLAEHLENGACAEAYFRGLELLPTGQIEQMLDRAFGLDCEPLALLYVRAMDNDHFDYNGNLLRFLAMKYPALVERLAEVATCIRQKEGFAAERIRPLWACDDSKILDALKVFIDKVYSSYSAFEAGRIVMQTIPIYSAQTLSNETFWDNIEEYIESYAGDARRMHDLSWAFAGADDAYRIRFLSLAIAKDKGFAYSQSLYLRKLSATGEMGKGFASSFMREADALRDILDSLPDDSCYLMHRQFLIGEIRSIDAEVKKEYWNGFHEIW